jgi:hypothetical protein
LKAILQVLPLADGFYLAFYPLAYVALMQLIRSEVKRLPLSGWLDCVVAGLGAAAVGAALGFETILRGASGPPMQFAVNLAYPIADLILLALAIGGLAIIPTWKNRRWLILVFGCAANAVGDIIYLVLGRHLQGRDDAGRHVAGRHFPYLAGRLAI